MQQSIVQRLRDFMGDEAGATAIEYGLIAALISVVIIGALMAVNGSMTSMYDNIRQAIDPALVSATSGS